MLRDGIKSMGTSRVLCVPGIWPIPQNKVIGEKENRRGENREDRGSEVKWQHSINMRNARDVKTDPCCVSGGHRAESWHRPFDHKQKGSLHTSLFNPHDKYKDISWRLIWASRYCARKILKTHRMHVNIQLGYSSVQNPKTDWPLTPRHV